MLDFYEYLGAAISIHAAREGGDDLDEIGSKIVNAFQSTPPVKAATVLWYGIAMIQLTYFNPRRP